MNQESSTTTIKNLVSGKDKYTFVIERREFHKISNNPKHPRYFKLAFGHDGILHTTDYDNEKSFLRAVCRAWDKAGAGDFLTQPNDSPIARMFDK